MSHRVDFLVALALSALGVAIVVLSADIPQGQFHEHVGPRALPLAMGAIMAVIGAGLAVRRAVWWSRNPDKPAVPEGTPDDAGKPGSWQRSMAVIAATFAYVAVMPRLGFYVTTPLFLAAVMWLMNVRAWPKLVGASLGFVLVVHLLFVRFLNMGFPAGTIWG